MAGRALVPQSETSALEPSTSRRRLPSLKSLEAFAVAGRTLSFKNAARELNITPSAVSRRIKTLEDDLGIRLFRRSNRALALTEAGESYLATVASAFDSLQARTDELKRKTGQRLLKISLLPSFASNWLVPRLPDFHARHPQIELEFDTTVDYVDLDRDDFDLAIRLGLGRWPRVHADWLMGIEVFPVCARSSHNKGNRLKLPEDLASHVLLHSKHLPYVWHAWLRGVGAEGIKPRGNEYFDNMNVMYQAAVNGLGVGIGFDVLVEPFLAAGQLVVPFDFRLRLDRSFYLVRRPADRDRPAVRAFHQWISGAAKSR